MKWPWVSRLVVDAVTTERDRLLTELAAERSRNADLVTQLVAAERKAKDRTPRHAERDPMPPEVAEYVGSFSSPVVREQLKREIAGARKVGRPWAEIIKQVTPEEM